MIIPIRCFTCNKVLANKWNKYLEELEVAKNKSESDVSPRLVTIIDEEFFRPIECRC